MFRQFRVCCLHLVKLLNLKSTSVRKKHLRTSAAGQNPNTLVGSSSCFSGGQYATPSTHQQQQLQRRSSRWTLLKPQGESFQCEEESEGDYTQSLGGFHQARIFHQKLLILLFDFLRPTADLVYFGCVCTLPSLPICASGCSASSATTTVILCSNPMSQSFSSIGVHVRATWGLLLLDKLHTACQRSQLQTLCKPHAKVT